MNDELESQLRHFLDPNNGEWKQYREKTDAIYKRMFVTNGTKPMTMELEELRNWVNQHTAGHTWRSSIFDWAIKLLVGAAATAVIGFMLNAMFSKLVGP
jgi:hypothetical protein